MTDRSPTPPPLRKFPRTRHLEGSRPGQGDDDLALVAWGGIAGRSLVVTEKIDGANAAVSFDAQGRLWLQSRGHYLTGGPRERHFAALKTWATTHAEALREVLASRYVMYGEWTYARHTIYYDALPHYFLEFDVLDVLEGLFLSTPRRRALLDGAPVTSVPVLADAAFSRREDLVALVGRPAFQTDGWRGRLVETARTRGLDAERVLAETDPSGQMEGLYMKVEEKGRVVERLKWVRRDFTSFVADSGSHWLSRPIVPNGLARDMESLFDSTGRP